MGKNIVERGRPQLKTWRMRIACLIPKATNTLSKYVTTIHIPRQQWLHELASLLRHTYIVSFVVTNFTQIGQKCGN